MRNSSGLAVLLLFAAALAAIVPGAAPMLSNLWDAFDCGNLTFFARIALTDDLDVGRITVINFRAEDTTGGMPRPMPLRADPSLSDYIRRPHTLETLEDEFFRLRDASTRQLLLQKLALLRALPEQTSVLLDAPGMVGRVHGDVLYVAQCAPVQVPLRRAEDCYDAVPVYDHDGRPCFVTSSRILVPHAEKIACHPRLAPFFTMGQHWVSFKPYPWLEEKRPDQVKPTHPQLLDLTGERITADEQAEFVEFMTAPLRRGKRACPEAADDTATKPKSRTTDIPTTTERAPFKVVIVEDERAQASQSEGRGPRAALLDLGPLGRTEDPLLATLVVLWVAQYVLTALFNLHALWRFKGCSWALCAAFFYPAANYVLHSHHAKERGRVYIAEGRVPLQTRA